MSCAIIVQPHEMKETTLKRWEKIYALVVEEKRLTGKAKGLRSYQNETKEKLRGKIKDFREGESGALKLASRKMYRPADRFVAYLNGEWEMAFETYQVLEFIFRATIESYERNLFDYSEKKYAEALSRVKGSPEAKYDQILKLIDDFSVDSFFALKI